MTLIDGQKLDPRALWLKYLWYRQIMSIQSNCNSDFSEECLYMCNSMYLNEENWGQTLHFAEIYL